MEFVTTIPGISSIISPIIILFASSPGINIDAKHIKTPEQKESIRFKRIGFGKYPDSLLCAWLRKRANSAAVRLSLLTFYR